MITSYWRYYRRRPTWADNLSLPQAFGVTVLSILAVPFIVIGAVLLLYFFLAHLAFNTTFWAILIPFCIWCLFQSK